MTVRVELDYAETAWENARSMGMKIAADWQLLAESRRAGYRCYQQVVVSDRDHFLMSQASNSFFVSAWDVAIKCSGVPKDSIIVKRVDPSSLPLMRMCSEDTKYADLVRAGDLPALRRRRSSIPLVRTLA